MFTLRLDLIFFMDTLRLLAATLNPCRNSLWQAGCRCADYARPPACPGRTRAWVAAIPSL